MSGHTYDVVARCRAQQTAKGDDRRQAGKVEEKDGGNRLEDKGVLEVGPVPGRFSLDVVRQTAKPSGRRQWLAV